MNILLFYYILPIIESMRSFLFSSHCASAETQHIAEVCSDLKIPGE